jgi:peptidylprolyl isomerase
MKKLIAALVFFTALISTPSHAQAVDLSTLPPESYIVMDIDYVSGQGQVIIRLYDLAAPKHIARIKELIRQGFYEGLIFHRVIEGFMAQTGDPKGDGTGGSGQNIDAEFNRLPHVRGTLSMARAEDENSADSQFFICFDRRPDLDDKYTIWGRVVKGMEYVDMIPMGVPAAEPGKIIKMRVAADIAGWPNDIK